MKSAFGLAIYELNEIRQKNSDIEAARRNEIYKKIPQIFEIDRDLMSAGAELSRCILTHQSNFEDIKRKIQELNKQKKSLLAYNKYDINYLQEIYSCEKCRDTGFVGVNRCECLTPVIIKHLQNNANLSENMKKQTFENFDFSLFRDYLTEIKKAVSVATLFADNFENESKNLLILGGVGTGKTYLSSCIANRALKRGKCVYYQSAYKLFDIVEQVKFGKTDIPGAKDFLDFMYTADLLIIDDLGTEFVTSLSTSAFFDILNTRLSERRSMIINSNLAPEEMEKIYSKRVVSRIFGEYELIQLASGDLRVKK